VKEKNGKNVCNDCGKQNGEIYKSRRYGVLLCRPCQDKRNRGNKSLYKVCSTCGEIRSVRTNKKSKPICRSCNRKKEICSLCGKMGEVSTRTSDGQPICRNCRRKDHSLWEVCSVCGEVQPVKIREKNGASICGSCYYRKKRFIDSILKKYPRYYLYIISGNFFYFQNILPKGLGIFLFFWYYIINIII
jgi:formylmethanofuran dehydrogenase subunit E